VTTSPFWRWAWAHAHKFQQRGTQSRRRQVGSERKGWHLAEQHNYSPSLDTSGPLLGHASARAGTPGMHAQQARSRPLRAANLPLHGHRIVLGFHGSFCCTDGVRRNQTGAHITDRLGVGGGGVVCPTLPAVACLAPNDSETTRQRNARGTGTGAGTFATHARWQSHARLCG
jgi:hypothetical protein